MTLQTAALFQTRTDAGIRFHEHVDVNYTLMIVSPKVIFMTLNLLPVISVQASFYCILLYSGLTASFCRIAVCLNELFVDVTVFEFVDIRRFNGTIDAFEMF